MLFNHISHSLRALFLFLCLSVWLTPTLSHGEENEDSIDLFNAWKDTVTTVGRTPKPLSLTAENVTIITSADIEAMNAHTLADILDTVPGVQQEHNGGPGVPPFVFLHSAGFIHTQVLLDGVSITNLSANFTDVSTIPARIIERVEIVKGPASTAWGQAIGGVINVITKSPGTRLAGGSATATIGERTTADTRAELTGTVGNLGYYLSGGYLGSNGLLPGRQTYTNQTYAKLTYDLPNNGKIWGTFGYTHANRGIRYVPQADLNQIDDYDTIVASLGFRYNLNNRLELELAGRYFGMHNSSIFRNISDGLPWQPVGNQVVRESVTGAGVKLTWRGDNNLLVGGVDYNRAETYNNTPDNGWTEAPFRLKSDRWSLFLNDTLTLGPVSIAPGIRLDHTQENGNQFGANLGLTLQITENTLLRGYTGRGNGLPQLFLDKLPAVKVWASHLDLETTAIPYLWIKGSLFRNETWENRDALNTVYTDSSGNAFTIPERRIALGAEIETRTVPVYHTSLGAGYTFTETTRTVDRTQVRPDTARQTLQLSLRYDDKTFRGWLNGRHVYWNSPPEYNGKSGGLIWDLHLGANVFKKENSSLDLFFSGHNLFNTKHYYWDYFPTTGRWFEGGMRVKF